MAGGHGWQGACVAGGCAFQGVCTVRGGKGACMAGEGGMAGETVTEAGSTHPTGMHSCL